MRRGFSLIEVLVALSVLALVGLAMVALSNSLSQGTLRSADQTVGGWLASEGSQQLEGVMGQNSISANGASGWLKAAFGDNGADYGWYKLVVAAANRQLTSVPLARTLTKEQFLSQGESLTVGNMAIRRLICIESVAANDEPRSDVIPCNIDSAGSWLEDGLRQPPSLPASRKEDLCQSSDLYCQMTLGSLNTQRLSSASTALKEWKAVYAGNAVKVRSVVAWRNKDQIETAELATLLTNWREGR